ncbi:hypothetical protein [Paenibacillus sp.]|uniref:hypothetical protein n=1 Tax=Paenibacillus sp. TaxID=58172 RepID=UPI002D6421CE|nr:hypothetical protein [Paenibacillus sp.]HZG87646.1 hypothetical protein [Paenibacillus sp.]
MITAVRWANDQQEETTVEEWLALRGEIRNRLVQLKKLTELGVLGGLDDSLEEVNRKIEKYNEIAPGALGRKAAVTRDTFIDHIRFWE